MIYITSDIHGRLDRLIDLINKIELSSKDKLIILGDLVDRGNEPIEVIEYVMNNTLIEVIMGNHDEMMLYSLKYKDEIQIERWNRNGNQRTLEVFKKRSPKEQMNILEFIEKLPYFKLLDNKFLLVHAGFEPDRLFEDLRSMDLSRALLNQKDRLVWVRESFFRNKALDGIVTIFGHSPVPYINKSFGVKNKSPYEIWIDPIYHDKIGIDTANCYEGRLACLCIDDGEVYYID